MVKLTKDEKNTWDSIIGPSTRNCINCSNSGGRGFYSCEITDVCFAPHRFKDDKNQNIYDDFDHFASNNLSEDKKDEWNNHWTWNGKSGKEYYNE